MLEDSGISVAYHSGAARARRTLEPLVRRLGDALTAAQQALWPDAPKRDSEDRLQDHPRQHPIPVLPDMVHFTGAQIREGLFDTSQRPATCAALKPTEDCARSQDPREVPEIALDDFYLDKHEVTSRELAAWLEANAGL